MFIKIYKPLVIHINNDTPCCSAKFKCNHPACPELAEGNEIEGQSECNYSGIDHMNEFYVYILKCSDGSYYIGHTSNIESRIARHQEGRGSEYTQTKLPIQVVYVEKFPTRMDAFHAERKIKGWTRAKKELLIKSGWEAMKGYYLR